MFISDEYKDISHSAHPDDEVIGWRQILKFKKTSKIEVVLL